MSQQEKSNEELLMEFHQLEKGSGRIDLAEVYLKGV